MRAAHDVGTVRAAEAALMATVPEGTLMQRAAAGLARTCALVLGRCYGARVVLLVGSGDNGGDALFAGAALAGRGARVDAVLLSERAHPGGLAALLRAGGRVVTDDTEAMDRIAASDLVVDGIVGIGGSGALRPRAAELVARAEAAGPVRVAVDLPSGVDADSGHVAGPAFRADVTVTFGCLKPGLVVHPGHAHAGVVELVDIGLRPWLPPEPALLVPEALDVAVAWPRPVADDDKYSRGVVGVVAGSAAFAGAAVLSVGGAVQSGAGLVRYVGDVPEAVAAVRAHWPEAVVGSGRVQALVVGPGLGTGATAAEAVRAALGSDVPVLVDADALTLLAAHPDWVRDRPGLTVLTPHDREFARFGAAVGADRVAAARALAAALGVVVLLKGSTTVVARPDGTAHVNPTGTPLLASGGTGDVLAGIVGALLAAGLGADAAVHGAFVHGLAARLAGAAGGPVTAMAVARAVPAAVASLPGPPS
ncbi:MAG: NAD(P)H-hydrate dehydratase [Actinomycetia bacterium]|nr:NAD(P)H-hydrate dehydratase [Actinomycetes bacterium]